MYKINASMLARRMSELRVQMAGLGVAADDDAMLTVNAFAQQVAIRPAGG